MQNFSIRPEVQLRALNKLLTMPDEDLGKGAGTSPQAPRKGWEVEPTSLSFQAANWESS